MTHVSPVPVVQAVAARDWANGYDWRPPGACRMQ